MKKSQVIRKPLLLKVPAGEESSFIIKGDDISWNNPWHFHPEIELLFCIRGRGTNFVGGYIHPIEEGELLFIGKNLPHTRQRDRAWYEAHPDESPETIVIQFREELFGDNFFNLRECVHIRTLLQKAQRGLKFLGATRDQATAIMKDMKSSAGVQNLVDLIRLLDILGRSEEYVFLNGVAFVAETNNPDSQKINRVYGFTEINFRRQISLADVADLVNLTEASFCRYFKSRTRKSYFQYLSEVRVAHACRLLAEQDVDVSEAGLQSGFNNLSNFHKQFKRIMRVTPKEYREAAKSRIAGRV